MIRKAVLMGALLAGFSGAASAQVVIQTAVAQPAPFNPAPRGTYIETTAGKQTVKDIAGYDVTFEGTEGQRSSHALLITDLEDWNASSRGIVERLWPLAIGKSETVNLNTTTPRTVTYTVLRTETIPVPAGLFYTYVIERRDRWSSDGNQSVATSWYAPSIGSVVRFIGPNERPALVKAQPSFELTSFRPFGAQANAVLTPVTWRLDTVENQLRYCQERGTTVRLADGRIVSYDCPAYVQVDRVTYDNWLLVR